LGSSVVSSAILVFLYCFFSFVIVLLFGAVGVTTLEVELYQAARSALDFARAGKIALIESVTAAAVVALYAAVLRRTNAENSGLRGNRPRTRLKGLSEYLFTALFLAGLLVFFMGPLVSVAVRSFSSVRDSGAGFRFTLEPWKALFGRSSFGTVLFNTVSVGISTAVLSTAAALFFAVWSESGSRSHSSPRNSSLGSTGSHARTRASSSARFRRVPSGTLRFLSVLPLAPLAVSSVMLGFGWTLLVPSGVPALLVLAQSAVSWPIVWSQIQTSLDRVPASVKDAAEVMSDGRLDRAFRVYVPLARKGILSGAAFSFAFSAGDATLPLVLSIGRFENLALRLFRLAGAYRFAEACACALLIALLCAVAFFLQDAEGPERSVHAENKGALL
jgi:thiamine transport system permease protein